MLLAKFNTQLCMQNSPVIIRVRRCSSVVSLKSEKTVTTTSVYPPIKDVSFKARFREYRENWANQVKKIGTVEEKAIKINIPRYWGFKCLMYDEHNISYNELPHAQFITRTHLASQTGLPSYYDNVIQPEKLDKLVEEIRGSIEDGIVFELTHRKHNRKKLDNDPYNQRTIDDKNGDVISREVNRIILSTLSREYPHLLHAGIDFEPRIEAFWFIGGFITPKETELLMKKRYWHEVLDEPINRPIQYLGKPTLHLRHHLPLKEILPLSECKNPELEVPIVKYDPRTLGHCMKRRHGTTIPGFWPGDTCAFGLLSYHQRGYLLTRPRGIDDDLDALKTQSILANYAWLSGQANHLGFTTFNDVTYPLVNQSITTNGQFWSFCVYQLNTTLLNAWHSQLNPKRNICWITEPLQLYEKIEDGKLVGINDEVLKHLIKFYVNEPQMRNGVVMRPYLNHNIPTIAHINLNEKRVWLENLYKFLMSNRPRHKLMPELYHWERIYKHMFKQRPLDKRRTPYDYGINPLLRRLDEKSPSYIPKALREHKKYPKFEKTYYPK